jgi:hypothetical protein
MEYRMSTSKGHSASEIIRNTLRTPGLADCLDRDALDTAGRLYVLATQFPNIPAGVLLRLAKGALVWRVEENEVVIETPDPLASDSQD